MVKLWEKLSFPFLSIQQVSVKVDKVIKGFELYEKRQNKKFEEYLDYIFDITQPTGNWLCSEDKEFYQKQIESRGQVGYTTEKITPISMVHP